MSEPQRQILTPGDTPPAVVAAAAADPAVADPPRQRAKPGPKPRAAAAAPAAGPADDLAEFDSDDLPPPPPSAAIPMAEVQRLLDEQAAKFRAELTAAIQAAKSAQDPATAARLAAARIDGAKLPTIEAAKAMSEAAVEAGQRPRAVLTAEGWYVHPEMARTKASGVAALGAEV